jgi:hypothetical protein
MLDANHVVGSHIGANIAGMLLKMMEKWKLQGRIHVVLRDNAASMIKAMEDAHLPSFGCVSHTLQLSVNKALRVQRAVEDVVANCRRIATHFSKSTLAKHKLEVNTKSSATSFAFYHPRRRHQLCWLNFNYSLTLVYSQQSYNRLINNLIISCNKLLSLQRIRYKHVQ